MTLKTGTPAPSNNVRFNLQLSRTHIVNELGFKLNAALESRKIYKRRGV